MPQAPFEHMIPVFERAKTVHALDRAVTAIGLRYIYDIWYQEEHVSETGSVSVLR
jgi:hypothetical protein